MTQIQTRDPIHLKNKYTPALRRLPELAEDSEEFMAFAGTFKKVGFIRPILIDEQEHVIDDHSRTQLRAALRWQLKEVPVQVCSSADAPMILIHSLAHVRHLSKSAIAYLAVPNLQPAFEAARLKRLENLRKSQETPERTLSVQSAETTEGLAVELGISATLLKLAKLIHTEFSDKKKYTFNVVGGPKCGEDIEMTLREWYEPKILMPFTGGEHEQNRPMGLGGIIAGITAVKEGNRDKFNPKAKGQLSLFEGKLDFFGGWKYWGKLSVQDKHQHFKNFEQQAESVDAGQRDELADYLEMLAKKVRSGRKAEK